MHTAPIADARAYPGAMPTRPDLTRPDLTRSFLYLTADLSITLCPALTTDRAQELADKRFAEPVSGSLAASRSDNPPRLATDTPKPPLRQHTTSNQENQP